jgi:two-component sensor histidine kinase
MRVFFIALILTLFQMSLSGQRVTPISADRFSLSIESNEAREYFEDTHGVLTIDEVWGVDSLFDQGANGTRSDTAYYWTRVRLLNNTAYDMEVIVTGPRTIHSIVYKKEGDSFFSANFGSFVRKGDLNRGDSRTHVSLMLKAGVPEPVYFRGHGRAFTVSLTDAQSFKEARSREQWQDALFYGAQFILILYSLIQFVVYRKRMFFYLTVFAFGYAMYGFAIRGYFVDWFMPDYPKEGLNFSLVWLQLGHLGGLLLSMNFLELKQKYPRWHKVFLSLIGLALFKLIYGLYLTVFLEDYGTMTNMSMATLLIDIITFMVLLFALWKKVNTSRRVFLVGLVSFGIILILGIIVWQFFTFANFRLMLLYIASTASLSQVIIFSIALGIQMRQYEVDKKEALDVLNSVLKEQNKKVEKQVVERTAEINRQNLELEKRNERIETLFREIHHRVKNNLQLISSLLTMQQEWSSTQDPAKALEDSRSRVVAMSMIHQFLYRTDDISTIDFKQYAEELASKLDYIQVQRVPYQLKIDFDKKYVFDIDTSISLGLILNELITNSYKHAAQNKQDLQIELSVAGQGNDYYQMTYRDNGSAIEMPFEEIIKKGFGLRLASRLARQLQGKFTYKYAGGNQFSITFASEKARLALADD